MAALTWAAVALGKRCTALDYARARRALTVASRDMADVFKRFDVLLLPTTAELPVRIHCGLSPYRRYNNVLNGCREIDPDFLRDNVRRQCRNLVVVPFLSLGWTVKPV